MSSTAPAAVAVPKKVRAAKKATPSKDAAPKAKRGESQRVSTPSQGKSFTKWMDLVLCLLFGEILLMDQKSS
jgi:hypothetical protein